MQMPALESGLMTKSEILERDQAAWREYLLARRQALFVELAAIEDGLGLPRTRQGKRRRKGQMERDDRS